jgi:hypothetical protein
LLLRLPQHIFQLEDFFSVFAPLILRAQLQASNASRLFQKLCFIFLALRRAVNSYLIVLRWKQRTCCSERLSPAITALSSTFRASCLKR